MSSPKTILRFTKYFGIPRHPDMRYRISDFEGFGDYLEIQNRKAIEFTLISGEEFPHHEQTTTHPRKIDVKTLSGKYHLRP